MAIAHNNHNYHLYQNERLTKFLLPAISAKVLKNAKSSYAQEVQAKAENKKENLVCMGSVKLQLSISTEAKASCQHFPS